MWNNYPIIHSSIFLSMHKRIIISTSSGTKSTHERLKIKLLNDVKSFTLLLYLKLKESALSAKQAQHTFQSK